MYEDDQLVLRHAEVEALHGHSENGMYGSMERDE